MFADREDFINMNTQITKLLGIKYPIIQGGMAWVATASLAAAVSHAGGIGLIAGGAAPADVIRAEIRRAKELTDRPFGVNVMLMSPYVDDLMQLCIDEKVALVTTGAGNAGQYIPALHQAGAKVIPVVPSVALAKRMERAGADAVVAEGMESGGHIGELTTMALVPQVCDAVDIPVVAAGGIADGRGVAAAIMLGAQGVQIGTRFLVAKECDISRAYKDMVLGAKDTSTAVTGRGTGHPCRGIRNKLTKKLLELEEARQGLDPEEFEKLAAGSLRRAVQEGDTEGGSFYAGQIAGMVRKEQTCAEIIREITTETKQLLQNACMIRGIEF